MFKWIKELFHPHKHDYLVAFSTEHDIDHKFTVGNIHKTAYDANIYKTIPKTYTGKALFQIMLCKCNTYRLRVLSPIGEIPMNQEYVKVMIEIDLKRHQKINNILEFVNKNKKV